MMMAVGEPVADMARKRRRSRSRTRDLFIRVCDLADSWVFYSTGIAALSPILRREGYRRPVTQWIDRQPPSTG